MKHQRIKIVIGLLAFLLATFFVNAQTGLRFPEQENAVLRYGTHYHFKETDANAKGFNHKLEFGYSGAFYSLVGVETFKALKGGFAPHYNYETGEDLSVYLKGFTSFNVVLGFRLVFGRYEEHNYNIGLRMFRTYRGKLSQGYYRDSMGVEFGYSYNLTDAVEIGVLGTWDNRRDQEIFGWPIENKLSSFLTLTFNLNSL